MVSMPLGRARESYKRLVLKKKKCLKKPNKKLQTY